MTIKDREYWKEYNQRRKEKGYFQQNYLKSKVVKNGEEVVKSEMVVKTQENILQPEPVVKNDSLQPQEILQPHFLQPTERSQFKEQKVVNDNFTTDNILQLCFRCPEIEKQLKDTEKTLDLIDNQKKEYFKQLEKELQQIDKLTNEKQSISNLYDRLKIDFNNKVKSLLEIDKENEKLNQKIKELEKPINPTIELWKRRYFDLEKKSYQQTNEQSETIKKLKERFRELYTKNQELEKHKEVKNSSQNQVSIPKEADVIPILLDKKHKKIIFYSCPSPCYEGKSCNNCSFFTQSTIEYEHIQ